MSNNRYNVCLASVVRGSYNGETNKWSMYPSNPAKVIRIPCQPNTQYTLSIPDTTPNSVFRISTIDNNNYPANSSGSYLTVTDVTKSGAIHSYTFTTNSSAKFILFQSNHECFLDYVYSIMLNFGSTALPYEMGDIDAQVSNYIPLKSKFVEDFGDIFYSGKFNTAYDANNRQYYTSGLSAASGLVSSNPYPIFVDESYCYFTYCDWTVARKWTDEGDTYIDTSTMLGTTSSASRIIIEPNRYYLFQFGRIGGGDITVGEPLGDIQDRVIWNLDENDILKNQYLPTPIDWSPPYPPSVWTLNEDDILTNALLPEVLIDYQGAFNKCAHLVEVTIPKTVKSIGKWSFRETALTSVTIASDCTYYDTSFPENCVINFYPD